MKKITAYVKPFKLESLIAHLPLQGIHEVLISEVRGYGRQKNQLELYQQEEFELTFLPKARMDIYCEDGAVAELEKAIVEGARTGRIGDGKIIIADVEQAEPF